MPLSAPVRGFCPFSGLSSSSRSSVPSGHGRTGTSLNLLSEPLFQDSEDSPNTEGSEVILGKLFFWLLKIFYPVCLNPLPAGEPVCYWHCPGQQEMKMDLDCVCVCVRHTAGWEWVGVLYWEWALIPGPIK